MKIKKVKLAELPRCYAVSHTYINKQLKIFFASEGEDKCISFDAVNGGFANESVVWDKPGGTMSIVFIPGRQNEFLAVQKFLPTFQAENAELVWGRLENGSWKVSTCMKFPFLHRFDIIESDGVCYFIGCTLATSKKDKDDWSDPGKIYGGILTSDLSKPVELEVLKSGLVKNHGYCRGSYGGIAAGYASSSEGVFAVVPPNGNVGWNVVQVSANPTSDIAFTDIDGDGVDEMAAIEEFHGRHFRVYKKDGAGKYCLIYEYDGAAQRDFGHVVWGGTLRGIPAFIGGYRRPVKDFFYIKCVSTSPVKLEAVCIDSECAPSNIDVVNENGRDLIITANRESAEADVYIVTDN